MHLQGEFPDHKVDAEYTARGVYRSAWACRTDVRILSMTMGMRSFVPDVIVHARGEYGPNILVLELKKANNPEGMGCDRIRVLAFRERAPLRVRRVDRMRDARPAWSRY